VNTLCATRDIGLSPVNLLDKYDAPRRDCRQYPFAPIRGFGFADHL